MTFFTSSKAQNAAIAGGGPTSRRRSGAEPAAYGAGESEEGTQRQLGASAVTVAGPAIPA